MEQTSTGGRHPFARWPGPRGWPETGPRGPHSASKGRAPVPNLQAILANSDRVARHVAEKKHLADQLRRHGINLVEHLGPVRFTDPHTLTAGDGRSWRADRIILAVGGHAARLSIPGSELALTYSDIRTLKALPAATAIVGAADTGCQIASILADLGSRVSLFEAGPTIVPHADLSISTELDQAFQRKGIHTHINTVVTALRPVDGRIMVEHATPDATTETAVDAVFFAVGWPPNIEQLGLDAAGISAERHGISVDAYLRTQVDHIFAAGDVNGRSMLVQVARLEGRIAAQNALMGPTRQVSYDIVPSASFTDPEYGGVGLTETEAARQHEISVGIAHYDDLLRPVADGHQEGFCKLIVDRHQKTILGGHVLGGVFRRDHSGSRRLHDGGHDHRSSRRTALCLSDLHRGHQHGSAEDLLRSLVSGTSPPCGATSVPSSKDEVARCRPSGKRSPPARQDLQRPRGPG